MKPDEASLLVTLLRQSLVGVLAVLVDGKPYQGLVPFVFDEANPAFLIHVSSLARHTQGLTPGAPFSLMIHGTPQDPLQTPRASFSGTVEVLEKGSEAYAVTRQRYLARFPAAEITFSLGDFQLMRLAVEKVRFVVGFARAYSLTVDQLQHRPQEIGETSS